MPIFEEWERIVARYAVSGKGTHDARLVEAMTQHQIKIILTFNVQDFVRHDGIAAADP